MNDRGKIETFSAWVIRMEPGHPAAEVLAAAVDGAWNGFRHIYLFGQGAEEDSSLDQLVTETRSAVNDETIEVKAIRLQP